MATVIIGGHASSVAKMEPGNQSGHVTSHHPSTCKIGQLIMATPGIDDLVTRVTNPQTSNTPKETSK